MFVPKEFGRKMFVATVALFMLFIIVILYIILNRNIDISAFMSNVVTSFSLIICVGLGANAAGKFSQYTDCNNEKKENN